MADEFFRPSDSRSVKLLTDRKYLDLDLNGLDAKFSGNLNINVNGKNYKTILIPSLTKKLYIFLSAAAASPANSVPYPLFFRMTWSNFIDGICLYLDDINRQSTFSGPTFFVGNRGEDFFAYLAIIRKIALTHKIDNNDICFVSSSNGGFASILLCNLIHGSRCISFNGQLSIPVFFNPPMMEDKKTLFETFFNLDRNDDIELLSTYSIINNSTSKFFLFFNLCSEGDRRQLENFCKSINYEYTHGIQKINDNIILAIEALDSKSPHHAQPNEESFLLYDLILQHIDSIDKYVNFYKANIKSLARYFVLEKQFSIQNNTSKFKSFCMNYATLRIDLKNKGNNDNSFNFLSIDPPSKVFYPNWFTSNGRGAVILSDIGSLKIKIKCIGNGNFYIFLRGVCLREKDSLINKKIVINCTKFILNDTVIFSDVHQVWHDEPFIFEKKVLNNEIISLSIEWQPLFFGSLF